MSEPVRDRRFWLGIILIIVGGTLLLSNLDIVPYYIKHMVINWKTLLMGIGLYLMLAKKKVESGLVVFLIGAVFWASDYDLFDISNIWHIFWPVVILAVGISLVMRKTLSGGSSHTDYSDEKKNDLNYLDDFAIFGGHDIVIDSQQFRGGRITAVFGGSNIDCRNAELAEGSNVIDVFAMFGGASIVVPPDWTVIVEVSAVLGGFSDRRNRALRVVPDSSKVLVIKGFVLFGGGDVKLTK